ncbi:MAG: hypothetical protein COA66_07040 [Arcobacter sp.]|nr:MAG: hypothetical protein COA66_14085 [Arcobacter sp.]PHR71953.1 MAG: hypothetical protein COA66_07040 [Arcobacter sp.]
MKYITQNKIFQDSLIVLIIFVCLKLMDFNQTMTSFWIGPYLSAAVNFNWSDFALYVNWDEIKQFANLSASRLFEYNFTKRNDLLLYDYLSKGLVFIVIFSKKVFFWQGDLESLQSLQYIVHICISLFILSLLEKKYQQVLFFIFYAINPIILYFVNYPFYYFWQVIPSVIFIYWYFNQDRTKNLIFIITFIFVFVYIIRPTVLFLIILFYILYAFKDSYKKSAIGLGLFLVLINISPSLSIGPWHTMYVGIGAYENKYNITLSDTEGYKYYKEQTGKTVNSDNIMNTKIKTDYYKVLKKKYFEILDESPMMIIKHLVLNVAQSYSIGYKVGNLKMIYFSAFIGVIMMLLLLYTKQYILFLAIGFAGGGFTPYYPPIAAYMYGSYILIVIGFIGIVDYFILKRYN